MRERTGKTNLATRHELMDFLLPDYIDPAIPLTRRQRKAIRKEAWKLWMKDWRNVLVYLALLVVTMGSVPLVLAFTGRLNVWQFLLIETMYVVIGSVVFGLLQRFRFAPLVRRVLRRHGYESCVKCGYWLRELDAGVELCPECGTAREPHFRGVCPTCRTPIGDANVCLGCGRTLGGERTS